jgi:hypothetical protein
MASAGVGPPEVGRWDNANFAVTELSEVLRSPAPMLQVPAEHSVWFEVAQRLC